MNFTLKINAVIVPLNRIHVKNNSLFLMSTKVLMLLIFIIDKCLQISQPSKN